MIVNVSDNSCDAIQTHSSELGTSQLKPWGTEAAYVKNSLLKWMIMSPFYISATNHSFFFYCGLTIIEVRSEHIHILRFKFNTFYSLWVQELIFETYPDSGKFVFVDFPNRTCLVNLIDSFTEKFKSLPVKL